MGVLYKLIGLIILISSLVLGWFWQSYSQFQTNATGFSGGDKTFVIKSGASVTSVVNQLISEGIIADRSRFMWMVNRNSKSRNIQAGEYSISAKMSPKIILQNFINGKVKQHSFTVVEGWNFKQMITALSASDKIKHTLKDKTPEQIMKIIGHKNEHPEGRFLPDTYYFPAGTSDKAFLSRAYKVMQKILNENWEKRDKNLPYKTAYEALILASIVEKETGVAKERDKIAGVFIRRLQKNMRLQTDPTVIYGMGDKYKGNLRRKDLKKDTPYNTYRRKGLPPTPIALPGAAAIKAALNPAEGDALYFVAKGDGSHYFSATMDEHNKAVKKYQVRYRKKNYRSVPKKNNPEKSVSNKKVTEK